MDRVEKMLGRMKASKLYRCVDWDPEGKAKDLVDKFNSASRSETMTRTGEYLGKLFAHMGKECYIEPPFYCDYGTNIHVGDYFYANTGLIVLDPCDVIIGDHAFLGPRVNIYCACHPIDAMIRNTGVELGKPVTIGDNVWIGGNTVINPGVTIGSNVVIGSGSVVTKDIPDGVLSQLGNKIQHALHAYTPGEQKGAKAAAQAFRENPEFNTYEVLQELEEIAGIYQRRFVDRKMKSLEILEGLIYN